LNETDLVWTSSKDGQLGTGEVIQINLSNGDHVITLTATDAEGFNGSAEVNVTVVFGVPNIIIEERVNGENAFEDKVNESGSQSISVYPNELCFDCEVKGE
ncbi:MAG: hypothetical protein AABX04_01200, partial [Nanoarchaeota archaeon]